MMGLNNVEPLRNKVGVRKMKKTGVRIDMTPMVDLGFLLIAFFIFTTEISKPVVTSLYLPHDSKDSIGIPESKSLTILLGNDDKVFCYHGNETEAIKSEKI